MLFSWISASWSPRYEQALGFSRRSLKLSLSRHSVRQKENLGDCSVVIPSVLSSIAGPHSSVQLSESFCRWLGNHFPAHKVVLRGEVEAYVSL